MGDIWITDMRHFAGAEAPDAEVPPAARRLARYLDSIIESASAAPPGIEVHTAVACWRLPGRRPCGGWIDHFEDRLGWMAAEANHTRSRRREERLDEAYNVIASAVGLW